MKQLRFLGVTTPTARPPVPGASALTITPRDRWPAICRRLALHDRTLPNWAELCKQLASTRGADYTPWPQIDLRDHPLGVAWFALVEASPVEVDEAGNFRDAEVACGGRWLPEPAAEVMIDPEFMTAGVRAA